MSLVFWRIAVGWQAHFSVSVASRSVSRLRRRGRVSEIEHIARAVWFGDFKVSNLLMGLTAYFDDSGTDEANPFLVVAGFAASIEQWDRFTDEWRIAQQEFKAPVPFKAKEFDDARRGYGPYKDWPDSKRKEYYNRLLGIIIRRSFKSFGTALEKAAYQSVILPSERLRKYFYSPFAFSSVNCIFQVCDWRNELYPTEPVLFYFDEGNKNQGQLLDVAKRVLIPSDRMIEDVRPGDDSKLPPLQAADLMAFELCVGSRNMRAEKPRYGRYALQRLDEHSHEWLSVNVGALKARISELIASI